MADFVRKSLHLALMLQEWVVRYFGPVRPHGVLRRGRIPAAVTALYLGAAPGLECRREGLMRPRLGDGGPEPSPGELVSLVSFRPVC
jgi:hypothetical protein